MTAGQNFADLFDAVLGAEVAQSLGYQVGTSIILAHGAEKVSLFDHADQPFTVVGILAPTGTPVDRTIHIRLEGFEALHLGWQNGLPPASKGISAEQLRQLRLTPRAITAVLVKLSSPVTIFAIQRQINQYREEALTAILPGVALQQLWELVEVAERALVAVSAMVIMVGLVGMLCVLLTSLGIVLGVALFFTLLLGLQPFMTAQFGIYLGFGGLSRYEATLLGIIWLTGLIIGLVPGWQIYRFSLADGLTIRT